MQTTTPEGQPSPRQRSPLWKGIGFASIIGLLVTVIGLSSDILGFYDRIRQYGQRPSSTPSPTITVVLPSPTQVWITPSPFPVIGTDTPYPLTPQATGWVVVQFLNAEKGKQVVSVKLQGRNYSETMSNIITGSYFPFGRVPAGKDYSLEVSLSDGRQINLQAISITPGSQSLPYRLFVDFARPLPGYYKIDKCTSIVLEDGVTEDLCVVGVEIANSYQMKFLVTWTAHINSFTVEGLIKGPDVGNLNMYATDEFNNRYNHIELGGSALETVQFRDGETLDGWYLFPPPAPNAKEFSFHDDDNNASVDNILLMINP